MTPKNRKRGGQNKYVIDPKTGKPIVGLHLWTTNNRNTYYMNITDEGGKKKRKYLGKDYHAAKFEFEQLKSRENRKSGHCFGQLQVWGTRLDFKIWICQDSVACM